MSPSPSRLSLRRLLAVLVTLTLGFGTAGMFAGSSSANAAEGAPTRTVTVSPDRITYSSSAKPTTNFAGSPTVYASSSSYSTFMGFPAVALKPGETISGVSLKAYIAYVHGTGQTDFAIIPVSNSWQESGVTHRSQPAPTDTKVNLNSSAAVPSTATFELDAERTAEAVAAGSSFRVMNRPSNSSATLHAKGSNAPQLIVTITAAPPAPEPSISVTGDRLVFAHYFPPYPISIDNRDPAVDYYARHYLVPEGENGKFADVGGLLRDRPVARAPLSGSWKMEDLKTEVRQAIAAGIDGFAVDILSITGANWDRTVMLMQAASEVSPSFKIMLQPDATATAGKAPAAELASALAALAKYPSVHKLADGRVVISPFKAENKTPAQWAEILGLMETQHGVRTAFLPLFLNASKMAEYAAISIGFGNWGTRDPMLTTNGPDYAAQAHKLGKLWMQPVAIQDARPNQKLYDEAGNTEMLRASWNRAISQDADMVMLVTWNDYSEGGHFAPSADHGYTFLDISQYYSQRFKSGQFPAVTKDAIHVSHRVHRHATLPSYLYPMKQWSGTRTAPRDTVEVLTSLKASATVDVTVGTERYQYTAPAGVSTKLFPLRDGYTTATAKRAGASVASVRTKDAVTGNITQQDMTYHAVSSGR